MKTSPDSTGDLGDFIIVELSKRGISPPKTSELARLSATWRTFTMELDGGRKGLAARARGCSLNSVLAFLFSLLSPLRVHRPFSKDDDRSFWFSIDGKQGSFSRTDTGLVVSFIASEVSLTISESHNELHIGFAEHPTNPESPAHTV